MMFRRVKHVKRISIMQASYYIRSSIFQTSGNRDLSMSIDEPTA
jgi:hypothetical protein